MGRRHLYCRDRVDLVFCIKFPFLNTTRDELLSPSFILPIHKHKDFNVDSAIFKIALEKWRRLALCL